VSTPSTNSVNDGAGDAGILPCGSHRPLAQSDQPQCRLRMG